MSIKRSDPKVYDFSEPINNLHEGKASSGKDFRSPTKKGLEYPSFQALISSRVVKWIAKIAKMTKSKILFPKNEEFRDLV